MNKNSHNKIISLAYYLPQFHEIEENNRWWGEGFTEWVQLDVAKSYYSWHKVRRPDTTFGQYSLLDPEVMAWQNATANQYGIDGFLVFDYWFGNGKKLLEKPIDNVLKHNIHFRYAFCWANHSWYDKRQNKLLQQQLYLGIADYEKYFQSLLPHFRSDNYIKIDNKIVFSIFNPAEIPDLSEFIITFNRLALANGFDGVFWIADNTDESSSWKTCFDGYAKSSSIFKGRRKSNLWSYILEKLTRKFKLQHLGPFVYEYSDLVVNGVFLSQDKHQLPVVFTGWDTTPRHLARGTILRGFDLSQFNLHLQSIKNQLILRPKLASPQLILIKSWNEWAEGNVIEPDNLTGKGLLEAYLKFTKVLSESVQ